MPVRAGEGTMALYAESVGLSTTNTMTVLNAVDKRATMLDATNLIDQISLDKYLFVRDAHLQRRRPQQHSDTEDKFVGSELE